MQCTSCKVRKGVWYECRYPFKDYIDVKHHDLVLQLVKNHIDEVDYKSIYTVVYTKWTIMNTHPRSGEMMWRTKPVFINMTTCSTFQCALPVYMIQGSFKGWHDIGMRERENYWCVFNETKRKMNLFLEKRVKSLKGRRYIFVLIFFLELMQKHECSRSGSSWKSTSKK